MLTKKNNYLTIAFLAMCIFSQLNYSQNSSIEHTNSRIQIDYAKWLSESGVDTTSIDSIKASLNGKDLIVGSYAASYFADRNMTEYIPDIRLRFYSANNFSIAGFEFLYALYKLNASDIRLLLNNYVDSVYAQYILKNRDIKLLEEGNKYSTVYLGRSIGMLCALGDYSKFNVLVDFTENENPLFGDVNDLKKFIGKLDQTLDNKLYSILLNNAIQNRTYYNRVGAIEGLEFYTNKVETFSTLLSIAINDSSDEAREAAEDILLKKYHQHREVFDLEVSRLYTNNNGQGGLDGQGAALARLLTFNYPEILSVLKDAVQHVTFLVAKDRDLAKDCYDYYEPPRPDSIVTVTSMIDSLSSLVNQVAKLNWLSNANFAKEINNKLDNAKKHLLKKDSVNCYKEVKEFQKKVNEVYEETIEKEKKHEKREKKFVTVEGWKFLYYNAQYIMDRLPHKKNDNDDDGEKD